MPADPRDYKLDISGLNPKDQPKSTRQPFLSIHFACCGVYCRVYRNREGDEPYLMEFRYSGRQYSCPLVRFQPRTQSLQPAGAEEIPAREALAG